MSTLTDTLLDAQDALLLDASNMPMSDLRAFTSMLIGAIGTLEARARGNKIHYTSGKPGDALGLEGDLGVNKDNDDFYYFAGGTFNFLFNGAGKVGAFTPIAQNEFGTHPAFTNQDALNDYLLGSPSTGTPTPTPAKPTITGLLPISGAQGSTVVLTGTNFTGATMVSINLATVASFTVDSATQITAVLSGSQVTGRVRVTTPAGTGVSASDFTVVVTTQPPVSAFNNINFSYVGTDNYEGLLDETDSVFSKVETWGNGPAYFSQAANSSTTPGLYSQPGVAATGAQYSDMLFLPMDLSKGVAWGHELDLQNSYGPGNGQGNSVYFGVCLGDHTDATTRGWLGASFNGNTGEFSVAIKLPGQAEIQNTPRIAIPYLPPFQRLAVSIASNSLVLRMIDATTGVSKVVVRKYLPDYGIDPRRVSFLDMAKGFFIMFLSGGQSANSNFTIGRTCAGWLKGWGTANYKIVKRFDGAQAVANGKALAGANLAFDCAIPADAKNGIQAACMTVLRYNFHTGKIEERVAMMFSERLVGGELMRVGDNSACIVQLPNGKYSILAGKWGTINDAPMGIQQWIVDAFPTGVVTLTGGADWNIPQPAGAGSYNEDPDLYSANGTDYYGVWTENISQSFGLRVGQASSAEGPFTYFSSLPATSHVREGGNFAVLDGGVKVLATDFDEQNPSTTLPYYDLASQLAGNFTFTPNSSGASGSATTTHPCVIQELLPNGNTQCWLAVFDMHQIPVDGLAGGQAASRGYLQTFKADAEQAGYPFAAPMAMPV